MQWSREHRVYGVGYSEPSSINSMENGSRFRWSWEWLGGFGFRGLGVEVWSLGFKARDESCSVLIAQQD